MSTSIKITKLGAAFLGLIALFYYFSLVSEIGLLFILIGIFLGCYAVNIISGLNNLRKVSLFLPQTIILQEGKKSASSIELKNSSKQEKKFLTLKTKFGTLCGVNSVNGKSSRHLTPDVTLAKRGVYPLDSVKIESTYPFGLFSVSRKVKVKSELVVYPAVYECSSPRATGFETAFGGSFTGKHRSVGGSNFAGIRQYQPFDSIRSIHWKSSSKGQGLMVKEFLEELSGKISFTVFNKDIKLANGDTIYNCALRCAASLILSAFEAGHSIEILDMTKNKALKFPQFTPSEIILEYFARLNNDYNVFNLPDFHKTISLLSKNSSICLVSSYLDADVIKSIDVFLAERRSITIYLPHFSLRYKNQSERIDQSKVITLKEKGIKVLYYTGGAILQ